MPYDKRETESGWEVINSDTGEAKGSHTTEQEADDQLAALYANEPAEGEITRDNMLDEQDDMTKDVEGGAMQLYIPIQKVDAERHEVWGWGAVEQPDQSSEIMDWRSSRPEFEKWSVAAQKRSGGKSFGNVRAMHQHVAAGKLIDFTPDDKMKGVYVGAQIVDDNEWKKVTSGVYTGFSVGGSYLRRWPDRNNPGLIRYTAKPTELSIVDAPCIPGATFQLVKAAGLVEVHAFQRGENRNMIKVVWAEDEELEKWDESQHPRDGGKFAPKEGGGGEEEKDTPPPMKEGKPKEGGGGEGEKKGFLKPTENGGFKGRNHPMYSSTVVPHPTEKGKWQVTNHVGGGNKPDEVTTHPDLDSAKGHAEGYLAAHPYNPKPIDPDESAQSRREFQGIREYDQAAQRRMFEGGTGYLNRSESPNMIKVVGGSMEKAIPGAPVKASDENLPGEVGMSVVVEHMPAPNENMELTGNTSVPGQEQLARNANIDQQDLSAEFDKWLPAVGKMVEAAVDKAVSKVLADITKAEPIVPARFIKIVRKEQ